MGWILFGTLLGAILKTVSGIVEVRLGPETMPAFTPSTKLPRIVILGGGFGGMKAAECLEEELGGSAFITLVSDTNALLFTPMLAEVAGSSRAESYQRAVAEQPLPDALCARASHQRRFWKKTHPA